MQQRSCSIYELTFASAGTARDVYGIHGVRVLIGEGIAGFFSGETLALRGALGAQERADRSDINSGV